MFNVELNIFFAYVDMHVTTIQIKIQSISSNPEGAFLPVPPHPPQMTILWSIVVFCRRKEGLHAHS